MPQLGLTDRRCRVISSV